MKNLMAAVMPNYSKKFVNNESKILKMAICEPVYGNYK